jgi:hypothetical protein
MMLNRLQPLLLALILSVAAAAPPASAGDNATRTARFRIPYVDGIKLQTTYLEPKLTNANHLIRDINRVAGTRLRDWDTMWIQTIDIVLWKDLSRYFKTDYAVAYSSGCLLDSGRALAGSPAEFGIRMRQRYTALALWTNLYFYPLTTDCKNRYASGRIFEPFVAGGLGHTFFTSESVFKIRKRGWLYNQVRNDWRTSDWAWKMMAGFNLNLGNANPRLRGWLVTCSAFQIWNRMQGHSTMHLTDVLRIGKRRIPARLKKRNHMDIDLSGPYFSIAVGRYF